MKPSRYALIFSCLLVCFFTVVFKKEISLSYFVLPGVLVLYGILFRWKKIPLSQLPIYFLTAYFPFSKKIGEEFGHFGSAFNLINILMLLFVLVWLKQSFAEKKIKWEPSALSLPMVLMLVIGIGSILRLKAYGAEYFQEFFVQYLQVWLVPFVLYFLVFNTVRDRTLVKNLVGIILFATTVIAMMAIYEYMFNTGGGDMDEARIGLLTDEPNFLGGFFAYYMFLPASFFMLAWRRWVSWSMIIPVLLCLRAIMVTFSRGAYLACFLGSYAVAFFRKKLLFLAMLVLAGVVFMNPYLLPEGIRYRVGQTMKPKQAIHNAARTVEATLEPSAERRVEVWKAAVRMIRQNPYFGVGYGTFQRKVHHYWLLPNAMDTHNTYLRIATEMGIPALVFFLWILLVLFWNACVLYYRSKDLFMRAMALGFIGGFFAFLAVNYFISGVTAPEIMGYFWILAALTMRVRRLEKADKHSCES